MDTIQIRRRCGTAILTLLVALLTGFGCGEEESIPADIVDINEIPCPSCDRNQEASPDDGDALAGSSAPQASPAAPSADNTPTENPGLDTQDGEESAREVDEMTAGTDAPNAEPEVEITPAEPEVSLPVIYDFDDQESLLYVQVFRDQSRLLSGFSHNHVIRATAWTTQFSYDANDPANCRITASVPVEQLRIDETAMRQLVQEGYNGSDGRPVSGTPDYQQNITDNDRSQIRTSMLSVSQLNSLVYPNITLNGVNCSGMIGLSGQTVLDATMTVKGFEAPVDLVITYDFSTPGEALIRGKVETDHATLGMEPYVDLGGTVGNAQPLTFTLDLLGRAR